MDRRFFVVPIFGALISCPVAASYFSDTNSIQPNRIMLGGGLRHEGFGFTYQRQLAGPLHAEAALGFFPVEGLHVQILTVPIWRTDKRFRPLLMAGISHVTGFGPVSVKVSVDGSDPVETEFETEQGWYGHLGGGFQFRVLRGLGAQYMIGWRQELAGGGYSLESAEDRDTAEEFLGRVTGSGISSSARCFLEF